MGACRFKTVIAVFRKISPYAKRRVRSRCILYICSTSDHFFDGSEMKRKMELILPQLSRHPIIRHQHFFPLHIGMDIDTHRGSHIGMSKQFAYCFHVKSMGNAVCGKNMPLRYNYDKPEKPRRIKGFEVFSLVFSSFSKLKNHTEISRIIGGVSLTTNE